MTTFSKWLLCSSLLALASLLAAQEQADPDVGLREFNARRLERNRIAMGVLGGWAITNIAGGALLASRSSGEQRYFHQMNAYWNGVNLLIAGFGYYSALKGDSALGPYDTAREHYQMQGILLLNAGLDVGYMLGGAYLMERAKNQPEQADRWRGFGRAIVWQGAFLFLFDVGTYLVHRSHDSALRPLLGHLRIDGQGIGLVWPL